MNNETIIESNRSWFYIDWKGLLHYRDLLFLLVRRDFITKYKQTILGPAWFVLQPLLITLVFTIVFGNIAHVPTDGIPPILFYLCSLLVWNYFSQCLSGVSGSLNANAYLFSKVYFPRVIVPLSVIMSQFLFFVIQFLIFLGFFSYFKFSTIAATALHSNALLFFIPVLTMQMTALALGTGLWIAALSVRYRDLQHLFSVLIQFWMYATPIIYPASAIPEKWRFITILNPMVVIVEAHRYAFFETGIVSSNQFVTSFLITSAIFMSGIVVFNKTQRTFVDCL